MGTKLLRLFRIKKFSTVEFQTKVLLNTVKFSATRDNRNMFELQSLQSNLFTFNGHLRARGKWSLYTAVSRSPTKPYATMWKGIMGNGGFMVAGVSAT